jgi:hypothetical protein
MDLKIIAPCVNCITKSLCRHKSYYTLVTCPLLKELYHEIFLDPDTSMAAHKPQREALFKALNPTNWWMDEKGWVRMKETL